MPVGQAQALPWGATRPGVTWRTPRGLAGVLPFGVRLAIPLAALLLGGFSTFVGVVAIQELGVWVARCLATRQPDGHRAFLAAYSLRCAIAFGLNTYSLLRQGRVGVFQDDYTYNLVGQWMVRIARGEGLVIFEGHQHVLDGLFLHLIAATYAILGYVPLVVLAFNAALAGLCAVLLMEMARDLFGARAALFAGLAGVFWPTLVLWSVVMLKEMLVLFGILLALRSLQKLSDPRVPLRQGATTALLFVAGLALVDDMRQASFLVLAGVTPIALAGRFVRRVTLLHVGLTAVVLLGAGIAAIQVAQAIAPGSTLARLTQPDTLARSLAYRRATEAQSARSSLAGTAEDVVQEALMIPGYREPDFQVMSDVIEPLGFALLAPAPWQARGTRDLLASGEMLLVYALLVGCAASAFARPRIPTFALALALYATATWLMLAFAEGNLGNLLRHRMMLLPTTFVLGGGGLLWLLSRTPLARRLPV